MAHAKLQRVVVGVADGSQPVHAAEVRTKNGARALDDIAGGCRKSVRFAEGPAGGRSRSYLAYLAYT